jgi:hypothetical protein
VTVLYTKVCNLYGEAGDVMFFFLTLTPIVGLLQSLPNPKNPVQNYLLRLKKPELNFAT